MSLQCPKCHAEMHQYERNGIVVDQCTECRGLFLDRGELEKLVSAENGWYGGDDRRERRPEPRQGFSAPHYEDRRRQDDDDDDDDHRRYRYDDDR